jgi:TPR repeat protein
MKSANDYLLLAAQGGHREAQFQYAISCFRGDVLPRDFESGKRWLATAAENGWARAEFLLFQLYFNGLAASPKSPAYPKDTAQAIKWLRRAAEHDNLQAQSILAVMLIQGTNVKQDMVEAEKLLRNGAVHGYDQAQNDLGFAILNWDLGTKDLVEAAMWCKLAASQSTDTNLLQRAKVNLSNALLRLTADQRIEVERRVKNFQALPVAEIDPMLKGWEKNGIYQPEDGRFSH